MMFYYIRYASTMQSAYDLCTFFYYYYFYFHFSTDYITKVCRNNAINIYSKSFQSKRDGQANKTEINYILSIEMVVLRNNLLFSFKKNMVGSFVVPACDFITLICCAFVLLSQRLLSPPHLCFSCISNTVLFNFIIITIGFI